MCSKQASARERLHNSPCAGLLLAGRVVVEQVRREPLHGVLGTGLNKLSHALEQDGHHRLIEVGTHGKRLEVRLAVVGLVVNLVLARVHGEGVWEARRRPGSDGKRGGSGRGTKRRIRQGEGAEEKRDEKSGKQ